MARPATRNIGRLSEIAQVAVKHGFGYFFERHRLTDLFPWIGREKGGGTDDRLEGFCGRGNDGGPRRRA